MVALIVAVLAPLSRVNAAEKKVAIVVAMDGHAKIMRGNQIADLQLNQVLLKGDRLATGTGSFITVMFGTGVTFRLGSNKGNTEAMIDDLQDSLKSGSAANIRVERGSFAAFVRPHENNQVRVTTPTAIAAVRGTEFAVDVDKDGTDLYVKNGAVGYNSLVDRSYSTVVDGGSSLLADGGDFVVGITEDLDEGISDLWGGLTDFSVSDYTSAISGFHERMARTGDSVINGISSGGSQLLHAFDDDDDEAAEHSSEKAEQDAEVKRKDSEQAESQPSDGE